MLSIFLYHKLSSDAIYFTSISVFRCYLFFPFSHIKHCLLMPYILKKGIFSVLFTNKTFLIHKIKKIQDKKLRTRDPLDRKISQNVPVIPDNLMEPITSKALSNQPTSSFQNSNCSADSYVLSEICSLLLFRLLCIK